MVGRFTYQLSSNAEDEYVESYLWYEEQQDGLGERFAASVRRKLNYIAANPELYSKKKGHFRETQLDKSFPFVIIYLIDKKQKLIVVTSIFHTSRNPTKKYRRK